MVKRMTDAEKLIANAKPSELIDIALADLKAVERQKSKYTISMWYTYHEPQNSKCIVCFAGAVMAKSLNADPKKFLLPDSFSSKVKNALLALDCLRCGSIREAFDALGIKNNGLIASSVPIIEYDDDKEMFKKNMKELANGLRALGY